MLPLSVRTLSALYSHAFLHQRGFKILTNTKGAAIICRKGMFSSKSMITISSYYCQDTDKNFQDLSEQIWKHHLENWRKEVFQDTFLTKMKTPPITKHSDS